MASSKRSRTQIGKPWYEYGQIPKDRFKTSLGIAYAEVATHNHFVLDRGGFVFKQTAPIVKLSEEATEEDYLALLAYLNSSTACFWMKQVAYPKGAHSEARPEKGIPDENRFAFSSSSIAPLPLPAASDLARLIPLARTLESHQRKRDDLAPANALAAALAKKEKELRAELREAEAAERHHLEAMVALQEDLDWMVYGIFGLVDRTLTRNWTQGLTLAIEARPFIAKSPPPYFGVDDQDLWRRRRETAATHTFLGLLENPVNKRKWWGARGVFASKVATYEESFIH